MASITMTKSIRRWMLPLLFLNITLGANLWTIFGLSIGQVLYWLIIALAFAVSLETPYRGLGTFALVASLMLRVVESASGSNVVAGLRIGMLGLLFLIAGARLYGEKPDVLHRQLIMFLALSIPVMLLQVAGAHSVFMMWNTEYAHNLEILTPEEIGIFKVIPVYPTLFRGEAETHYMIGQGRPVGLLYSNNVLSIFVAVTAALHLATARTARFRRSDVIIIAALVLTMSLNAFATTALIYLAFLAFGEAWRRRLVLRLTTLFALMLLTYLALFPGLFANNFSNAKLSLSLLTRGLDLANALGLNSVVDLFADQREVFSGSMLSLEEGTYSLYSAVLKSTIAVPVGILTAVVAIRYLHFAGLMRRTTGTSWTIHGVTGVACMLTQFGTNYIATPSVQLILGLVLFPLFRKMWPATPEGAIRLPSGERGPRPHERGRPGSSTPRRTNASRGGRDAT